MNEGAFFASLAANRVAQLERQLAEERARLRAVEEALAFERRERERASGKVIEMGHLMMTAQREMVQVREAAAAMEPQMRARLREEVRHRVQSEADHACQMRLREMEDLLPMGGTNGSTKVVGRNLSPYQVMELRELVLGAFEDARQIARRGI